MKKRIQKILGDTDQKEILSKGFSFLGFRLGGTLIGYFFTLFITQKFGADIYGIIALGFSVFLIISVIGRLGLDINLVRFFSEDNNNSETGIFYKSVFKSFLVSFILASIIYFLKEPLVMKVFREPKPELLPYLPWILAAIPFWSLGLVSAGYFRAKKQNQAFAFFNNPSRFLFGLIILLILYNLDQDPIIIVKAHFYGVLITSLLSFGLVTYQIKNISFKSEMSSWNFIKDSLPMMLSSSILILLGWMDTFIMGIYEDTESVGIYNISLKVATLTTFTLQAINSILAPKIAKSYAADEEQNYKKLISFSTKLNFLITVAVMLIIVIFHDFLLGIFGEEFKAGYIILFIFCAGQLVNSLSGSVGIIMQMIGKQKVYQNFVIIALFINLALTFILTPLYGGIGAAVSTVISMVFWNIGCAVYLKKKMNIRSYYDPINY
ncbi:MAG: flippase [Psychroflexus sp.]